MEGLANQSFPALAVLWRRLDHPGHESARLVQQDNGWLLAGTAVFAHDAGPCRLDYQITCDPAWGTRHARIAGWDGNETVAIDLAVDAAGRWLFNGTARPEVAGCIDLDLNFSPSTNLLPIRRLGLAVGQEAQVRAAWLRFPGFALEPLDQSYRRIGQNTYVYASAGGRFVAELQVNEAGFVTEYPGVWLAELSK